MRFEKKNLNKEEDKDFSDQIEGRNSVLELLESGKDINKIFIERGEKIWCILENWGNALKFMHIS